MSLAYYNEFDPKAAAWLCELIRRGLIAPGDVDDRSILDVKPADLAGYDQCHFFAGIGGWSLALRLAGWADARQVWTGSCTCQPFSCAGKAGGVGDERHLWPAFRDLIRECRPAVCFGEQVASKAGRLWLAGVRADLEGSGYAVGAANLCAAGVGAPHIRQRLYWVADAQHQQDYQEQCRPPTDEGGRSADGTCGRGMVSRLADATLGGLGADGSTPGQPGHADQRGPAGGVDNANEYRAERTGAAEQELDAGCKTGGVDNTSQERQQRPRKVGELGRERPLQPGTRGVWHNSVWLPCRDGKARRVESGLAPLAHGVPARVVRLRGYGNAIVPPLAAEFVMAYMETAGAAEPRADAERGPR